MENTKTETIPTESPNELVHIVPMPPLETIAKDFADKVSQDPTKLLNALYWIWDAFERTNMPFFLVKQTAKDAILNHDLTGDKVDVGVRRMEWTSGGRRILDSFVTPISEDKEKAEYVFEGVPVTVRIYEDHQCIIGTDTILYRSERFNIPNPMKTFEEIYE